MTRSTGFPPKVRALVLERSAGRCELCGTTLFDIAGSVHHRRPRRMGGDRRPATSKAYNAIVLCGSGTTGCHSKIENRDRALAREQGLILSSNQEPGEVPCRLRYGWVILTEDGGYEHVEAPNG